MPELGSNFHGSRFPFSDPNDNESTACLASAKTWSKPIFANFSDFEEKFDDFEFKKHNFYTILTFLASNFQKTGSENPYSKFEIGL